MTTTQTRLITDALAHGIAHTRKWEWVGRRFQENVYVYHGSLCVFVYYSANNKAEFISPPEDEVTKRAVATMMDAVGAEFGTRA